MQGLLVGTLIAHLIPSTSERGSFREIIAEGHLSDLRESYNGQHSLG